LAAHRPNELRASAAVAVAALAARLAVVAWAGTRFPPAHDGVRYDALAARLAAGQGYTAAWPDGAVTMVAHYPVGYPAMLALAYRVLGHSVVAAGVLNALLGALTALAVHRAVLAVADRRAALAAGVAVALHPGLVLYTPGIMTECATAALVAAAGWIAVSCVTARRGADASGTLGWRGGSWAKLVALGVVVGAAALVRPQALLLAPLFGFVAARARGAAVCVVVAAVACAPWIARNEAAVGRATLSTNAGWNLLIGAQDGATGAWQAVRTPPACADVFGEATTDACFAREARADIAHAPARWIALVPRKLGATFDVGGIGGYYLWLSNAADFSWTAVVVAGAIETLFERVALALCLLGAVRAIAPCRRARVVVAVVGALALVSPWAWVAVVALCAALLLAGARWLLAHPLHACTLATLATTAAVHAVFFGAPRYALICAPLVTAVAAVEGLEKPQRRRGRGD
jgi:4-amino-4-deoxy-L-arabinose transferase-like glycosyltransferase